MMLAQTVLAQSYAKVYASDLDYANDNYQTFDIQPIPNKYGNYDMLVRDNRTVKQAIWAVEHNDSLWINNLAVLAPNKDYVPRRSGVKCKPRGFELVLHRSYNYLYFRGPRANVKGMYGQRFVQDDLNAMPLPIALGVAATGQAAGYLPSDMEKKRFNYVYDLFIRQSVYLSRGAMEEYYNKATGVADTSFRKLLIQLAKAQD
ncbi:MAG: hypothetical protein EOP51_05260 [Sphingobacteriales bacterium]|nr:MAG: hypothetical protein EOP51_05260 [Sphingobacteriales bacterium]